MNNNSNELPSLLSAPFLNYIPSTQELDFHLPSRTPLSNQSIAEWAGLKSSRHNTIHTHLNTAQHSINIIHNNKSTVQKDTNQDDWKDVYRNIKYMDQLYDASFYSWLKSEENVLVTSMYLHRIANEYPLVRIINALKWLISDWRLESISTLVRHVTVDWSDEAGDLRRAHLLRHLTHSWATQYTTTLITMVLSSTPYTSSSTSSKERFLRAFTNEWDFSKLSEFFMYLTTPANIDYRLKCIMLQEAAKRERESLSAKLKKKRITNEPRRHHRRTSSNDVNDIKRLRLSTPDLLDHTDTTETICRSVSPDQHSLHSTETSTNNTSDDLFNILRIEDDAMDTDPSSSNSSGCSSSSSSNNSNNICSASTSTGNSTSSSSSSNNNNKKKATNSSNTSLSQIK